MWECAGCGRFAVLSSKGTYRSGNGAWLNAMLQDGDGTKVILKCLSNLDEIDAILAIGQVFRFDNVKVDLADPTYNKNTLFDVHGWHVCVHRVDASNHDMELKWNKLREVSESSHEDCDEEYHNLIAVISNVDEPTSKITKNGEGVSMREICLSDETGSMSLTLWGEDTPVPGPVGSVIAVSQIKSIRLQNGRKVLKMASFTCMQVQKQLDDGIWVTPASQQGADLQPAASVGVVVCDWWQATGKQRYAPDPNDIVYEDFDDLDELGQGDLVNVAGIVNELVVGMHELGGARPTRKITLESESGGRLSSCGETWQKPTHLKRTTVGDVFAVQNVKVDKTKEGHVATIGRTKRITEGPQVDDLRVERRVSPNAPNDPCVASEYGSRTKHAEQSTTEMRCTTTSWAAADRMVCVHIETASTAHVRFFLVANKALQVTHPCINVPSSQVVTAAFDMYSRCGV